MAEARKVSGRKKRVRECCPLFTEALWSDGSFTEGLIFPSGKGERAGARACYAFSIPGRGRGKQRRPSRSLVLEHCPFCGSPPKAGPKPETSVIDSVERREASGG